MFIKQVIFKQLPILGLILFLFSSCNKENFTGERAMHVIINGYYDGPNPIRLAVDTTIYGKNVKNGAFIRNSNSYLGHSVTFPYFEEKTRLVTLTDTITNEVIFKKELPATGSVAMYNFVYFDGKELDLEIPKSNPSTNQLGFYVHYEDSQEPFDIQLFRKDPVTQQEFRVTIAEDVTPGKWVYFDYEILSDFKTRVHLRQTMVQFVKPNTIDQLAFELDLSRNQFSATPFPVEGEQGLVFPIFFAPKASIQQHAFLFYYRDRIL